MVSQGCTPATTSAAAQSGILAAAIQAASARHELIVSHLPYVKAIASHIHRKLRRAVPLEDLVSSGSLGLIRAVDAFDPNCGAQLRTFADSKIRGAIFDSLRRDSPVPGSARNRRKQIDTATHKLSGKLQRSPESQEIAAELGIEMDEYHRRRASCSFELKRLNDADFDDRMLIDRIVNHGAELPHDILERGQMRKAIAAAVRKLPRNEAVVIRMYYADGLTLQEIAQTMNLHYTRVHQIKKSALSHIRLFLEDPNAAAVHIN